MVKKNPRVHSYSIFIFFCEIKKGGMLPGTVDLILTLHIIII